VDHCPTLCRDRRRGVAAIGGAAVDQGPGLGPPATGSDPRARAALARLGTGLPARGRTRGCDGLLVLAQHQRFDLAWLRRGCRRPRGHCPPRGGPFAAGGGCLPPGPDPGLRDDAPGDSPGAPARWPLGAALPVAPVLPRPGLRLDPGDARGGGVPAHLRPVCAGQSPGGLDPG
jgi:hypothetical protein